MAYKIIETVLEDGSIGATPVIDVTGDVAYTPTSTHKATPVSFIGGDSGTGGVTSWNGQIGDVTYTPPVTSVNGQIGDVTVNSGSTVVRDETTPTASITMTNTPTLIQSYTTTVAGDYRFYISGLVTRTGGGQNVGDLTINLLDNAGVVLTSGRFEVFRDVNSTKQISTTRSFNLPADENIQIQASYVGTGTVTVSGVVCGMDII